jgi:hypothetical protein
MYPVNIHPDDMRSDAEQLGEIGQIERLKITRLVMRISSLVRLFAADRTNEYISSRGPWNG